MRPGSERRFAAISVNDVQALPRFLKTFVVKTRQFDEVGHENDARRLCKPQVRKGLIRCSNLTFDLIEGNGSNHSRTRKRRPVGIGRLCRPYHLFAELPNTDEGCAKLVLT